MSMRPAALRALIWFWGTAAGIGVAGAATLDVMGPPAAPESALAARFASPPAAAPVASLSPAVLPASDIVKAPAWSPAHRQPVRLAEALPRPPIPPHAAHRAPAIRVRQEAVRPRVVTVAAAAPPTAYGYAPPAYAWPGYYAPPGYAPGYAPGWSGYPAPRSYPYGYYARY